MSFSESQARQITAIRILEQVRDNGGIWTSGDAREASRAAVELTPVKHSQDTFVARRAELALEMIERKSGKRAISDESSKWSRMAAWGMVVTAFALGWVTDALPSQGRINLIEYPLVGLIAWNMIVYLWSLIAILPGTSGLFRHLSRSATEAVGYLRAGRTVLPRGRKGPPWQDRFRQEWLLMSSGLNTARLGLALHLAAMAFALGAVGSLYSRGIPVEYRASWESTWFSANEVHSILKVVLAPGTAIFDLEIPGVEEIEALESKQGTGGNARLWIHLYAGSLLGWILMPRLLLALANFFAIWRHRRFFPIPTGSTYFTVLRAVRNGGQVPVLAIPFRYDLTPRIKHNLQQLLEQLHGMTITISIPDSVLMGHDQDDWQEPLRGTDYIAVFVIFNLTATAEPDEHGRFVWKILEAFRGHCPVIPVIDTSAYPEKNEERLRERCNQWRSVLDEHRVKPVFLNLSTPADLNTIANFESRLNRND